MHHDGRKKKLCSIMMPCWIGSDALVYYTRKYKHDILVYHVSFVMARCFCCDRVMVNP